MRKIRKKRKKYIEVKIRKKSNQINYQLAHGDSLWAEVLSHGVACISRGRGYFPRGRKRTALQAEHNNKSSYIFERGNNTIYY